MIKGVIQEDSNGFARVDLDLNNMTFKVNKKSEVISIKDSILQINQVSSLDNDSKFFDNAFDGKNVASTSGEKTQTSLKLIKVEADQVIVKASTPYQDLNGVNRLRTRLAKLNIDITTSAAEPTDPAPKITFALPQEAWILSWNSDTYVKDCITLVEGVAVSVVCVGGSSCLSNGLGTEIENLL